MAAAAAAPPPFSVEGRVAIVTGAGSGISLEFSKLLLSRGCSVVIGDLSLRPEAQVVIETYTTKPRALFHRTDVTDWTSLQSLFAETTKQFGTFDIVCPGAGIFEPPFSNFWHPPGSAASRDPVKGLGHYGTVDINLTHPIRATQLALAEFMHPSDGSPKASPTNPKRVVHIASVAGEGSSLNIPMYVATKHAIFGFVRSLATLEDSHGVRVNAVAPGLVKTPLWLEHPEKMMFIDADKDEWVTPLEVAEAMMKLLEDDEMRGGVILECGHEHTRVVPQFGNAGPSGPGMRNSNGSVGVEVVHGLLREEGWGKVKREHG